MRVLKVGLEDEGGGGRGTEGAFVAVKDKRCGRSGSRRCGDGGGERREGEGGRGGAVVVIEGGHRCVSVRVGGVAWVQEGACEKGEREESVVRVMMTGFLGGRVVKAQAAAAYTTPTYHATRHGVRFVATAGEEIEKVL